jgi:hypothetical protein
MLLMGCLWLASLTSFAQSNGRVRSGTPLRWGMNSSVEVMEGDLAVHYGSNDTLNNKRNNYNVSTASVSNPFSTRFSTVQGLCDQNSILLNWVAVQQSGADRYDIEQSADGRNWSSIGVVPANRNELGEASYSFNYTKNASNSLFRISAVNTTGERIYSSIIESPCTPNSYMAVTPNPVYSTATVRIGSPVATKAKLMLVNGGGVVLQNREASLLTGTNQVPVDMSGLPAGYYTLLIQWKGGKQNVVNLIKQ